MWTKCYTSTGGEYYCLPFWLFLLLDNKLYLFLVVKNIPSFRFYILKSLLVLTGTIFVLYLVDATITIPGGKEFHTSERHR